MKKSILFAGICSMMLAMSFTSCKNTEAKIEDAQNDVLEAQQDVAEAQNEAYQMYENYKLEINEKILRNNQKIADLKVKGITGSNDAKARYNEKIAKLEESNAKLQSKLNNYTEYSEDTWESFKADVSRAVDSLENDFNRIND